MSAIVHSSIFSPEANHSPSGKELEIRNARFSVLNMVMAATWSPVGGGTTETSSDVVFDC